MPMRVMMVAPNFPPHRGGVETHTFEVGRRLAARPEIEVEVVTTDLSNELPPREEVAGMSVRRVRASPRNMDLHWAPAVAAAVDQTDADLVHVQGYNTLVPPLAMLAARRRRLPYVLTFHSGGHSSRMRHALRPAQVRLLRPLMRSAAALVAVSHFEADRFGREHGIGTKRIVTIPNGADLPAGSDPGPIVRERGLVLSIGRLERYKGHDRVIRAMSRVRASIPGARLEVLGSGPFEARLLAEASDAGVVEAVSIGGLPRDALPERIRHAGVVVLLSEYESHGLAAVEALALGARLVVTGTSALAELGTHPQALALPPEAPSEIVADAIISQLVAPPVDPANIPALPTWDDCADRLLHLYRTLLREPRSRRSG